MEKALELYSGTGLPGTMHQSVTGWLYTEISVYLRARREKGYAIAAPFAVFLNGEEAGCVQPDISVVSDACMLDEAGCHGAPDWVVEVVTSKSRGLDYGQKLAAYIKAGVKEYWVVDPERSVIVCFFLEEPDVPAVYHFGDIVKSGFYQDLVMDSTPLKEFRYGRGEQAAAGSEKEETRESGLERGGAGLERREYDWQEEAPINQGSQGREQEAKESMSADEVAEYLENHFAELIASRNKGQLMKAAVAALKGKADPKVLSEATAKLCRQEIS